MKYLLYLAFAIFIIFSGTKVVNAYVPAVSTWNYSENFNRLNDGNINAQDSWASTVSVYQIETTTSAFDNVKQLTWICNSPSYAQPLTRTLLNEAAAGDIYFSFKTNRADYTNHIRIMFTDSATYDVNDINLEITSGSILANDARGGYKTFYEKLVSSTWYTINLKWDNSLPTTTDGGRIIYNIRIHDGVSWSAFSQYEMKNSTKINAIRIDGCLDGGVTTNKFEFDNLVMHDPYNENDDFTTWWRQNNDNGYQRTITLYATVISVLLFISLVLKVF